MEKQLIYGDGEGNTWSRLRRGRHRVLHQELERQAIIFFHQNRFQEALMEMKSISQMPITGDGVKVEWVWAEERGRWRKMGVGNDNYVVKYLVELEVEIPWYVDIVNYLADSQKMNVTYAKDGETSPPRMRCVNKVFKVEKYLTYGAWISLNIPIITIEEHIPARCSPSATPPDCRPPPPLVACMMNETEKHKSSRSERDRGKQGSSEIRMPGEEYHQNYPTPATILGRPLLPLKFDRRNGQRCDVAGKDGVASNYWIADINGGRCVLLQPSGHRLLPPPPADWVPPNRTPICHVYCRDDDYDFDKFKCVKTGRDQNCSLLGYLGKRRTLSDLENLVHLVDKLSHVSTRYHSSGTVYPQSSPSKTTCTNRNGPKAIQDQVLMGFVRKANGKLRFVSTYRDRGRASSLASGGGDQWRLDGGRRRR
ncbi:hypothetical protein LXL04_007976 [Taraxacum kok-saghyz]